MATTTPGSPTSSSSDEDERTFDPRAPRSSYSLCTRSCYQCPNCIGPVQVVAVPDAAETKLLGPDGASSTSTGPFALICQYCNWSSREIGIEFDRHSGIHSQLSRVNNGGEQKITAKEVKERRKETHDDTPLPDDHFEVDANTDMWDDALKDDGRDRSDGSNQVEVGKVWERGRNWVSIILEVVPASLSSDPDKLPLKEGEDILEIPMFVRMEWESDGQNDMGTPLGKERDAREKRELAYWCVLGVGKIAQE
ncbi:dynactin Arp1 p62 subunit [Cordyceps fumosorosea ARSEF 2679]|uniref:Dynactin subunit 4 n=1 Tax=Cordyceps fumosorosea (strain ARSEF 2679) TaxID=1081104 RepID=A0A162IFI8_CORFA|nr:dynactin Arp1 p62 subunit [Cordyceps fumosorosea ARSEF 2679]OAA56425.1 dynactin Arp1 p62 subunit [Cordyceps fumosorosea ARSEF 2679]